MIIHDVVQGTEEWQRLRMGIPTASNFDRIITPTGRPSTAAENYMYELLAEILMGAPIVEVTTPMIDRGTDLEPEAVDYYEFEKDVETELIGFVTDNANTYGASPDRLVGDEGLLEVKCPSPHIQVGYLLYSTVARKYYPQLQGQLYVTERKWVDICSYYPGMPTCIIHVERDEVYIKLLAEGLQNFLRLLDENKQELITRGFLKQIERLKG